MKRHLQALTRTLAVVAAVTALLPARPATAAIDGLVGATDFALSAKVDYITMGDGEVMQFWGLANGAGNAQYPAPTLIVNQGEAITITLTNALPVTTSLIFPGQSDLVALGDQQGLLAQEALPGGVATYQFLASRPGTFVYHSGTSPELQVEMGLVGVIIVRPAGFDAMAPTAYGTADSAYDREFLFLMTEMDPRIHDQVEFYGVDSLLATDYLSSYRPNYWFFNGRTSPDTMADPYEFYLPTQPYNCMPMMHPGEKVLVRGVGGGRDLHPLHLHGNHFRVFARDGQLLQSAPGPIADLATEEYTHMSIPGETFDAIFEWTGEKLGWDIYGTEVGLEHTCNGKALGQPQDPGAPTFDPVSGEYCADHGKPLPVALPNQVEITPGAMWSGSPYLGQMQMLPPGQGGMNPWNGYSYMWHSHQEKDLVNNDTFPGGMMTMLVVMPRTGMMP